MRQRSLQNGRHALEGAKTAGFPHAGQATVRGEGDDSLALTGGGYRLQNESSKETSCS
jgi:hypothetical protein